MVLRDPERTRLAGVSAAKQVFAFTIGVCATGGPAGLRELVETVEAEKYPSGFTLRRIVIVASECDARTLRMLSEAEEADVRILLIKEGRRRGKAAAINRVIAESEGDFIVLVNGDALPAPGAISRLLRAVGKDREIGMASASPVIHPKGGMTARILQLMWGTHNTCAQDLNQTDLSNHGTDELVAFRLEAVPSLPHGVVNDGAYMAGRVRQHGFKVCSLEAATVRVDVPSRPIEIIRQRRRVLYGHLQVWRLVGNVPSTTESMMLLSPGRGFGALVRTISHRPSLIVALPFAAVGELFSFIGATLDTISDSEKHVVWDRYGD